MESQDNALVVFSYLWQLVAVVTENYERSPLDPRNRFEEQAAPRSRQRGAIGRQHRLALREGAPESGWPSPSSPHMEQKQAVPANSCSNFRFMNKINDGGHFKPLKLWCGL